MSYKNEVFSREAGVEEKLASEQVVKKEITPGSKIENLFISEWQNGSI